MIQNFAIDQAATFESLLFLSCEPKTAFGDSFRQETTKDGLPKWEAQLVARFRQFGRATNEIIKVGLVSERAPGADLAPATPVELVGFEIGVMDKKDRNGNVTGAQVWYRCSEVRSTASTAPRSRAAQHGTSEAAAS
ncbi:hypothetical protein [Actinomycetospora soli]|uniref:hypothetical protein n=1 Tax=Actinomycetospora soli TaxID=2893887 RepID=UPI001E2B1FEA|nr:hypothetical protein [Actinomycetospora soli]MCD2191468.1 hypothetical protein [Actinomycetospora soli]